MSFLNSLSRTATASTHSMEMSQARLCRAATLECKPLVASALFLSEAP